MGYLKENFNNFYQKLLATKVHIWSHCFSLLGWLFIFNCISFLFDTTKDIFMYQIGTAFISYTLFIILINFTVIELFFLKEFKIKCNLLINNRYYNIFWFIGITTGIFIIIPIFIVLACLHFII